MSLSTVLPISPVNTVLAVNSVPLPAPAVSNAVPIAPKSKIVSSGITTIDTSSIQAVTKDLIALLKDLSSGNVSESKADLARLQADLRTQASQSVVASSVSASQIPPFDTVLSKVAESLAGANTGRALEELASYLIQAGQASGNIVDEHA